MVRVKGVTSVYDAAQEMLQISGPSYRDGWNAEEINYAMQKVYEHRWQDEYMKERVRRGFLNRTPTWFR